MSYNYTSHNPKNLYFISFPLLKQLDAFKNNECEAILTESLSFFQKEKGTEITALCMMGGYVHLIFRNVENLEPESVSADLKHFVNKAIIRSIKGNRIENSYGFLPASLKKVIRYSSDVKHDPFWKHDNKPIGLRSIKSSKERIGSIHQNRLAAGLVFNSEDDNKNNTGEKRMPKDILVFRMFDEV